MKPKQYGNINCLIINKKNENLLYKTKYGKRINDRTLLKLVVQGTKMGKSNSFLAYECKHQAGGDLALIQTSLPFPFKCQLHVVIIRKT